MRNPSLLGAATLTLAVAASAGAAEVDPAVYAATTEQAAPRTFQKWGTERVRTIDGFRRKGAELAAADAACDRVTSSQLSELRTRYPTRVVISAGCSNGATFDYDFGAVAITQTGPTKKSQSPVLLRPR